MKKIITFLLLLGFLASCGNSQSDIDAAKQELLGPEKTTEKLDITPNKEVAEKEEKKSPIQIITMDEASPLSFDPISESSLQTGEVIISGKVTNKGGVDKIEVFFTNPTSQYPDDRYMLQAFKPGDDTFRYVASSKNQVLDFGQNEYIFTAYSGLAENQIKVILNVEDTESEEIRGTESQLIGEEDNFVTLDLPTSSKYGEPLRLGEASFTYTQIKGLEVNKEVLEDVSCETLTEYLTEKMSSWYYWNTCRDIVKDTGIKFNVIRLDGEDYIYERHYIDFTHGFYGTYELETGKGVDKDSIADKNTQLKEREFPSLEIVDDLMKDIVNS